MMRPLRALALTAAFAIGGIAPVWAQQAPAPAEPQVQPAPAKPAPEAPDAFGEELTLVPKTVVYLKGSGTWDKAFETLVDAFKSVYAFVDKQGLKRDGLSMTIYTQADDTGFQFQAAVPIAEPPKDMPSGDMAIGPSPGGRSYKFVHRGSYDSMDTTYEAITNFLDEKRLEAQDLFIEEYATDPVTTPDDKLVITVYVPVK